MVSLQKMVGISSAVLLLVLISILVFIVSRDQLSQSDIKGLGETSDRISCNSKCALISSTYHSGTCGESLKSNPYVNEYCSMDCSEITSCTVSGCSVDSLC